MDLSPDIGVIRPSRTRCGRCAFPLRTCLCDALPAELLETTSRIIVLVHPKEQRRTCGTLPLLRLCLNNLRVIAGTYLDSPKDCEAVRDAIQDCESGSSTSDLAAHCALLCPGLNAVPVEELPVQARSNLIFVDGRWPQARAMIQRSPWLLGVQRAFLKAPAPSAYRFRRQPEDGCLSTLEAVAESLALLEPSGSGSEAQEVLLRVFDAMVGRQLTFIPGGKDGLDRNASSSDVVERQDPRAPGYSVNAVTPAEQEGELCMCRWDTGDSRVHDARGRRAPQQRRGAPVAAAEVRRRIVVERILPSGHGLDSAKLLCRSLSVGRPKV